MAADLIDLHGTLWQHAAGQDVFELTALDRVSAHVGRVSIIASIIGTSVRPWQEQHSWAPCIRAGRCRRHRRGRVLLVSKTLSARLAQKPACSRRTPVFFIPHRSGLTGLIVWLTEYFTRRVSPVPAHRAGEPHRPRHERHRRPRGQHKSTATAGARDRCFDPPAYWLGGILRPASGSRGIFASPCSRVHAFHDRYLVAIDS